MYRSVQHFRGGSSAPDLSATCDLAPKRCFKAVALASQPPKEARHGDSCLCAELDATPSGGGALHGPARRATSRRAARTSGTFGGADAGHLLAIAGGTSETQGSLGFPSCFGDIFKRGLNLAF